MATFDRLADLPLEIEGYELQGLELVIPGFERLSTVIHAWGGGEDGLGEDVTYDAVDHIALQDAGPGLDLTGYATLGEFCDFIGGVDTFPAEPQRDVSRRYRRWAFESSALDLALRQSGIGIAEALGREPRPVTFVCSMRLSPGEGEPSTIDTLRRKLDPYPTLRFKLDPTNDWTDELIAELVETGAVDSLDLKGFYKGTVVDVETDPELYAKLIEAFPDAWIEDPDVDDETRPILEPVRDRLTWDAPIHSIEDIEALPWPPKMVNIKPSRIGGLATSARPTTTATSTGSAPMAAASGSSASAVARSRPSPRCSIPTPRTTRRRAATTKPSRRPGCRPARWSRSWPGSVFGGMDERERMPLARTIAGLIRPAI